MGSILAILTAVFLLTFTLAGPPPGGWLGVPGTLTVQLIAFSLVYTLLSSYRAGRAAR